MTFELKPEPSKMLVALDGSNISMNAADYAIKLAENNHNAEIFVIDMIDLSTIFKMLPSDTRTKSIIFSRYCLFLCMFKPIGITPCLTNP
jgi:Universal stress protein family